MKAWLISVVAVVLLLILMEVLLSEGNTKKYIQGIIRLVLIIVMLLPIFTLVKKNITYEDIIPTNVPTNESVDQSFLNKIYLSRYHSAEINIQTELKKQGINGAVVRIDIYYADSYLVEISNVYIDLNNAVITKASENIFINDIVINAVSTYIIVDKEKIIIYGQGKI